MTDEPYAIAVDVGGTNIRAAQISHEGRILSKKAVPGSRDPIAALAIITDLVGSMVGERAVAIGVGVPGRVNGWTGEVISGGFLDLSGVDPKATLNGQFGVPVVVANDCSMALLGESRLGVGKGHRNLAMLTIGTGIGGALMHQGEIVHGSLHAGQLGHIVVNINGQPCRCGQRGCVETESSGTSLQRHLEEAGFPGTARFEDVVREMEAGSPRAWDVLHAWARPLQAAIGTLSAAFNPEAVILGGGMGHAAYQALGCLPALGGWYAVEVLEAYLGDDAGVIGAGLAAFQHADRSEPAGKRLIMVNGVPASGKSSVARELSRLSGWPILGLDSVKDPFLEVLDNVDRPLNRLLGVASYKSIFSIIADAPHGSTFIVDAWFGFQPIEVLRGHIAMAGITEVVEIWCECAPEIVGARYAERVEHRPRGHPGLSYVPELIKLAEQARPVGLGPIKTIRTAGEPDVGRTLQWIHRQPGFPKAI